MREEFERRAVRVLTTVPAYVWDGDSVPVPVERIASDCFGLRICLKSPDEMRAAPGCPALGPKEQLSGLLLTDRGEIWVNAAEAEQSRGRGRFTICHELGHWVMHRHRGQDLFCRSGGMSHGEEESPGGPVPAEIDIEEEAHLFAAAMLMPMPFVQREYERFRDAGEEFFTLCERFGASGAAMGRRLHQVI
ncbi:MAG: ImmA/IrrE family metallo-endopeptidase [Solirubrobacterales bacterium]